MKRRKLLKGAGLLLVAMLFLMGASTCPTSDAGDDPEPAPAADPVSAPDLAADPGPDPTPSADLFYDDFEDGLDPAWSTTPGWRVSTGILWRAYTASHDSGNTYVTSGMDWTDYTVEVTLDIKSEQAGIMLRCQEDLENYVLLTGNHASFRFYVVVAGKTVATSEAAEPGFLDGEQSVRVVAQDASFAVYVNDLHRLSFTDDTHKSGMPGLAQSGNNIGIRGAACFYDFRVTPLE